MRDDPAEILRTLLRAAAPHLPEDASVEVRGGGRTTTLRLKRSHERGGRVIVEAFPLGVGTWLPLGKRTRRRLAVADAAETLQDCLARLGGTPWPEEGAVVRAGLVPDGVELSYLRRDGSPIFSATLPG